MKATTISRRTVLKNISLAAIGSAGLPRFVQGASPASSKIIIGLDAHSVRGMKWSALPLVEYAGEQKLEAVLLNASEVRVHPQHRGPAPARGLSITNNTANILPHHETLPIRTHRPAVHTAGRAPRC